MSKMITRTIKQWKVTIKDMKNEIISESMSDVKPRLDKIASKRIKETGNMNFSITIDEIEQQRAISVEDFMKYSKVIEPKNNETV